MNTIRVAVVDEHAVFRRGLAVCLADDPLIQVVAELPAGRPAVDHDVVVVSSAAFEGARFTSPVVLCSDRPFRHSGVNDVRAVVGRADLTPDQIVSVVRAVAAGLRVDAPVVDEELAIDERSLTALRLLSEGATTADVASELGYSERTAKSIIAGVSAHLRARTRTQAVAEAVRRGLI